MRGICDSVFLSWTLYLLNSIDLGWSIQLILCKKPACFGYLNMIFHRNFPWVLLFIYLFIYCSFSSVLAQWLTLLSFSLMWYLSLLQQSEEPSESAYGQKRMGFLNCLLPLSKLTDKHKAVLQSPKFCESEYPILKSYFWYQGEHLKHNRFAFL